MKEQYDFAFTFAGEDRDIVSAIEQKIKAAGYTVFYDNDHLAQFTGKDLYHHLRDIYMHRARYVVCFISHSYKNKEWTNLEFAVVKERLMSTFFASDFLLSVVLEKDAIPEDIPSFLGFFPYENVEKTVEFLKEKYKSGLKEDLYFSNIKNFQKYLLEQMQKCIKNRTSNVSITENSIRFNEYYKDVTYKFYPEDFLKVPCIQIYKDVKKEYPEAVITWDHAANIQFSFYDFQDYNRQFLNNLCLDELIDCLCKYIYEDNGLLWK